MKFQFLFAPLFLIGCSAGVQDPATSTDDKVQAITGPQLVAAANTAFPSGEPLTDADGVRWTFENHKLLSTPFGLVLISEGTPNEGYFGHATAGRLDVTFLEAAGSGYYVKKRYPEAVQVGSSGQMSEWAIVDKFSDLPTIYASGGFINQGVTEGCSVLVELTKNGPKELVAIPDYLGMMDGDEVEGKIENISKSQGFDVRYKGKIDGKSANRVLHYTRQGDRFVRQAEAIITHCGEDQ